MRKSLRLLPALLVCFCFILPLQAQTSKGSVLLGGSLGFSKETDQKKFPNLANPDWVSYTGKTLRIQPEAAFFLLDNLAVGSSFHYSISRSKQDDYLHGKNLGLGISPFVRYYKFIGQKLAFFGQGGANFSRFTYRDRYFGDEDFRLNRIEDNLYFSLLPGVSFFPTSRLGLQLTLGQFHYGKTDTESRIWHNRNPASPVAYFTANKAGAVFNLNQAALGLNFFISK